MLAGPDWCVDEKMHFEMLNSSPALLLDMFRYVVRIGVGPARVEVHLMHVR